MCSQDVMTWSFVDRYQCFWGMCLLQFHCWPWRWRQYVPLEWQYLPMNISQKTIIWTLTTLRIHISKPQSFYTNQQGYYRGTDLDLCLWGTWALDSCWSEVLDYQENVEWEVLKPVICRLHALVQFISIILFRRDVSYHSNSRQAFILHV